VAGVRAVDQDGEAESLGIVLSRPLSDGIADAPLESIGATDAPVPEVLVVPLLLHATRAALSARNRTILLIMWSPPKRDIGTAGFRPSPRWAIRGPSRPYVRRRIAGNPTTP
jgi:hypothetical protein